MTELYALWAVVLVCLITCIFLTAAVSSLSRELGHVKEGRHDTEYRQNVWEEFENFDLKLTEALGLYRSQLDDMQTAIDNLNEAIPTDYDIQQIRSSFNDHRRLIKINGDGLTSLARSVLNDIETLKRRENSECGTLTDLRQRMTKAEAKINLLTQRSKNKFRITSEEVYEELDGIYTTLKQLLSYD